MYTYIKNKNLFFKASLHQNPDIIVDHVDNFGQLPAFNFFVFLLNSITGTEFLPFVVKLIHRYGAL